MRPGEWALRLAGDGQIAKGEHILVYAAAEMDRYWAEAARTFVATENGLAQAETGSAGAVYESMVKAAAAGKKAEAPVVAVAEAAARAGIKLSEEYGYGNGLGLSLDEAPAIAAGSTEVLEAGMALSLRLFTKEQGGLMLGDTLIVNSQGSETVTRT
jgi:Xaa-Pro aminopeptidase